MKLKSALLLLSFSFFCLLANAAFADTLTLTSAGANVDGVDVYPYQFTVTGPGGTATGVDLSCLNFNREISFGETWAVDVYNVLNIPTALLSGFTEQQYLADALLVNQYAGAAGNSTLTSEIQYAIWSIMDPAQINSSSSYTNTGAFDSTAQNLASTALANALTDPASDFAHDLVFIPDTTDSAAWTNGTPQIFMTDSAPSVITPEPASLLLLGTGMVGAFGVMRRRFVKA